MNEYKYFSVFYDEYAQDVDYDLWFSYLKKLSGIKELQGKKILDLGCGTGALTEKFASAGAQVWGVDVSEDMLSMCDARIFESGSRCMLIKEDISEFVTNEKFDFVYSACDSINYLSEKSLKAMFANVHDMLNEKAVFTFDFISDNASGIARDETITLSDTVLHIHRSIAENKLKTEMFFESFFGRHKEVHEQFLYTKEYITALSECSGLMRNGMYEVLSFMPPCKGSDKLQAVFSKCKK